MSIVLNTERNGHADLRWLGSRHGSDVCETVTLDVAKFSDFGDTIPSGTPLKRSSDGRVEPVTAANDELAGFLLLDRPARGAAQTAPMLWHGRILVKNLPEKAFDVSTLTTVQSAFTLVTR